jgi:hypothetical protein
MTRYFFLFFLCIFIVLESFCQCKFNFDIDKPGPYCPKSENILLTAWDTTKTGGCVIAPGFLFQVFLDAQAATDNYLDIYVNGTFLQRMDGTNNPNWKNNTWLNLYADLRKPADVFTLKFCDKSKNGTHKYKIKDRATKAILTSGTFNGSAGCTTITVPKFYGIAIFSGPGVSNSTDGRGYFNPFKAGPGTHKIKYYFSNEIGFRDSTTKTVVVNEFNVTVNSETILKGCSATLTASGAKTYKWSTGFSGNPLVISPVKTTTYTVTGTDPSGCQGVATAIVTIDPSFDVTVNNASICEGDSAILKAEGTAEAYVWSTGETSQSIKVKPIVTTTYSVTGTLGTCGKAIAVSTVTVNPKPIISVNNPQICPGQAITLYASGAKS